MAKTIEFFDGRSLDEIKALRWLTFKQVKPVAQRKVYGAAGLR